LIHFYKRRSRIFRYLAEKFSEQHVDIKLTEKYRE